MTPIESLQNIVIAAHQQQFPIAIHAIGDGAVAVALDVIQESQNNRANGMQPDRIEHIEVVDPADFQRFRDLDVIASMHPHHVTCCFGNYILDRIGDERVPYAYAWRSFLDQDIPLVLGTDWPTATFNPLEQIADTLFREDVVPGNNTTVFDENMTLTFEEALYAYTQAAADITRWGDEIGSISVGKWADFVVLNNTVELPANEQFKDLTVTQTYWSGQQVYSAP